MTDDLGAQLIRAIADEYRKLKTQADRAVTQIDDRAFFDRWEPESNSIATLFRHLGGNLTSRWTDFLATDGEKPDRRRDDEFEDLDDSRARIVDSWEKGWRALFSALESLTPDDLLRTVTIRGDVHTVVQAIARNLAHTASHVGQIVFLAKHHAGEKWQTLSIPRRRASEG